MFNPESEAEALEVYRKLSLIRQATEAIIREYPKDEIKTPVHLGLGLEGISVGVAHCLPPNAKSFGQLRNHGQYLAVTGETDRFFGELYGRVTGVGGGKAGSMHLSSPEHGLMSNSGIVASTIAMAVGAAFSAKYRETDEIAVAMFGDSAIEEGEFWESLNFAALHGLRILFVCEDNGIAAHTFASQRRGFKSVIAPVSGFDCHVREGDGTDVREVISVIREAVDLMLEDPKPVFVRLTWFRTLEHVGPNRDFDVGYRPKPTEEELRSQDPVDKYEQYLLSEGYAAGALNSVRDEVADQIEGSMDRAKAASEPGEADLHSGVFV